MFGLGLSEYFPYGIYGLSFLVAFFALFYRSEIGILFIASLLPVYSIVNKTLKLELIFAKDIFDILIIAMLLGWLFQQNKKNQEHPIGHSPILIPVFLFIGYSLFSYFIGSSYLGHGFLDIENQRLALWKNYITMPVLYLISYYNLRERKWKYLLLILLFFSFLAMDFKFRQSFSWVKSYHFQEKSRLAGTLGYLGPNEWGSFHTIYTLFIIGLFLVDKNLWRRIAYSILIIGGIYSLMYSFSRGAYFGFVAGLFFISFIKSRKLLILLIVFLLFWKIVVPVSVVERVEGIFVEKEGENVVSIGEKGVDTSGRKHLWDKALNLFYENPIFGTGFNAYYFLIGADTHNVYLKILSEQGIIGFFIYLGLYFFALMSGWRLYRRADEQFLKALGFGFLCAVVGSIVVNFFGDRWTYLQIGGLYWIFWALVDQENSRLNLIHQNNKESKAIKKGDSLVPQTLL